MSKYVCTAAEVRTIENGQNAGQEYVYARFLPEGVDPKCGFTPRTLNFFAPTGTESGFMAAWKPTLDAVADGKDLTRLSESDPAYFCINAKDINVPMPLHAKKYRRDTTITYQENGQTKTISLKAGSLIRKAGTNVAQKFNSVNVFMIVDENDKPVLDAEATANRIFKASCTPWDQVPPAAKAPEDRGEAEDAKVEEKVESTTF